MKSSIKGDVFLFLYLIIEKGAVFFVLRFNLVFIFFVIACQKINASAVTITLLFTIVIFARLYISFLDVYEYLRELIIFCDPTTRNRFFFKRFKDVCKLIAQQRIAFRPDGDQVLYKFCNEHAWVAVRHETFRRFVTRDVTADTHTERDMGRFPVQFVCVFQFLRFLFIEVTFKIECGSVGKIACFFRDDNTLFFYNHGQTSWDSCTVRTLFNTREIVPARY